jgi:hypothetical protein
MKKSRTPAQQEAARRNGAKSMGPVTPEGKAKVRFNAVKHGFTADFAVIRGESVEMYLELLGAIIEEYGPETPSETLAIEEYAIYTWRLRRLSGYMLKLSQGKPLEFFPRATLSDLHREERQLQRQSRLALLKFQEIRQFHRENPPAPSAPPLPNVYDRLADTRKYLESVRDARLAQNEPGAKPVPAARGSFFAAISPDFMPPAVRTAA